MTQSDPETPDAPSNPDPPAEAFPPFTERPPEAEVWRRARQDYLGGDTAAVVCERYGLAKATFWRRATREGWRRTDVEPDGLNDNPTWAIPEWRRSVDIIEDRPEFAEVQAARDNENFSLLFNPHPDDLRIYAFRRACEAATLRKPGESAAWLRVQRLAEHAVHLPDPRHGPYQPEDYMRAAFLKDTAASLPPDESGSSGGETE